MNGRIFTSPLLANFVASDISGPSPMSVTFTNTSYGDYDESRWDFGDGNTSTLENPVHTYTVPGEYTVTLTISRPGVHDTITKAGYISIRPEAPLFSHSNLNPFIQQVAQFA